MLLETYCAGVGLTFAMRVDLAPGWLVDAECCTVEDDPVELPAASALACGDIGCSELEFAAAEGDEVDRIRVRRELVGVDRRNRVVCGRFTHRIRDGHSERGGGESER